MMGKACDIVSKKCIYKGSVYAEVVISPVNASVSENDPVTLTCTLTESTGTIDAFHWYYKSSISNINVINVGLIRSSCTASSIVPINTSMYEYACPSSTQFTWTIKKVTRQNQGDRYHCRIITTSEDEFSGYTFLNVQVPISSVTMTVPSTPTVTVRENGSEEFKCKTSGGLPAATVTWYKDSGTPGDSGDDIEITSNIQTSSSTVNNLIEVTSTLRYSSTRNDNGWRIYCTASNANGQTPVVSQRTLLNVQYPPDGPPVITGYTDGGEYRVIEGKPGQLSCTVSGGNPAPTLTWDCINSGTSQTTSSGTVTHTWTVQRGQDKTCTCRASHYSGNTDVSITIKILYPPTTPTFKMNFNTVSGTIKVIRDNSLSVTCISEGQPPPSYKWTKPNGATSNRQQLSVSNVQTNGRYTCDVQNTMNPSEGATVPGSNSSFIDVLILYPPTLPTFNYWNTSGQNIPTRSLDVIKDDTFKVACKSTGEPAPTYQWNNSGTNQILTVNRITADQSRTCTAINTMEETVGQRLSRSATATLSINVQYPPRAVTMKYHSKNYEITLTSSLSIIEGNPFRVNCSSNSKPDPSYRWTGNVSSSSSTVRVDSATRSQTGTLTCAVENTMTRSFANPEKEKKGTTTGSFNLNILYPPAIGELKNVSVIEGSTSTVSCPVTVGNPPETTFEWRRNGQVSKRTQSFTIDTTSRTDAMFYNCTAANVMQQTGEQQPVSQPDTKSFYLNVWYSTTVTEFFIVGHKGETSVTMNETKPVPFQCNADSNPGSSLSVIHHGHTQQTLTNTKSMTYRIPSATCTDSGVYSCVGFNQYNVNNSTRILNLFINCSPRPSPFVTLKENVTSELHKSAVLTFTTLAYPEPKAADFKWYRWYDSEWLPITNTGQFKVDTSNLQTNLTITDVNRTYFGMYRLDVKNTIGSWEQIFYLELEDRSYVTSFFIEGHEGSMILSVSEHLISSLSVDGYTSSNAKIMVEGTVLKEETNTRTLIFTRKNVACLDGGIYTCEGSNKNGLPSSKNLTLFVLCSPRPLHQMAQTITSRLIVPVVIEFTALAYPPPGSLGFTWQKQNDKWWTTLLSNADLHISSSALQSNLTIRNVSKVDFGHYRLNVSNSIGSHTQYFTLTGVTALTSASTGNNSTPAAIGISLGIVIVALAIYAVIVTIMCKRNSTRKGTQTPEKTTKQTTYVNLNFNSDATENHGSQNEHEGNTIEDTDGRKEDPAQYTSLDRHLKDDNTAYEVLQA